MSLLSLRPITTHASVLGIVGFFLLVSSVRAQEGTVSPLEANVPAITHTTVGLMAIPPRLGDDGSLEANPGDTIQTQVRVRNTSTAPVRVSTMIEDFIIGEDGKTPIPVLEQTNSLWSLAQWMELSLHDGVLQPGASQTIPVLIRVPQDALPGGRYAMILHQPLVGTEGELQQVPLGGQASISQRVGTLVYLRVAGEVQEEAHLRNVTVPGFLEFGPVPLQFEVENLSDIHITPSTVIEIRSMWGRSVGEVQVEEKNVFPYTLRSFDTQWNRVWGWGRYTARFTTSYGEHGKSVSAEVNFWIIPYKLIMTILLLILLLLVLIVIVRRYWRHRQELAHQQVQVLEDRIAQLELKLVIVKLLTALTLATLY